MVHANCMAIVFRAVESGTGKSKTSEQVWSEAVNLLRPVLGKFCGAFYPATQAWGQAIHDPFGVVFGRRNPVEVLELYAAAREKQVRAISFHLEGLLSPKDLENARKVGDALFCSIEVQPDDKEKLAHSVWHLFLQHGVILPDCGIYYAAEGKSILPPKDEQAILTNCSAYALCAVTLEDFSHGF